MLKEASKHLPEKGFVYYLRPNRRKEEKEPLFYDNFGKKDDIIETFVKRIEIKADLESFVKNLGFADIDEWWFKADGNRFQYCENL